MEGLTGRCSTFHILLASESSGTLLNIGCRLHAGQGAKAEADWQQSANSFRQALERPDKLGCFEERCGIRYNLACVLALKGDAQQAGDLLQQLLAAGGVQWEELLQDADLEDFRKTKAFQTLHAMPQHM